MYAIYIVECSSFGDLKKVIVLNKSVKIDNLKRAHAEIYECAQGDVKVFNELYVSDKNVFENYLQKLSKGNPVGFVDVSRDTIKDIVNGMTALDKVVNKESPDVLQFDNLSWSYKNEVGDEAENVDDGLLITRYPVYCAATAQVSPDTHDNVDAFNSDTMFATVNCSEEREMVDSKTIFFCRNVPFGTNKCIGPNSSDYYNEDLFKMCFPELDIHPIPLFPRHELANRMLKYKLTLLINNRSNPTLQNVLSIADKIRDFFGLPVEQSAESASAASNAMTIGPQTFNQSDVPDVERMPIFAHNLPKKLKKTEDSAIDDKKSQYVKRFVAEKCKSMKGCRIKSSELFSDFREFCTKDAEMTTIAFDRMFSNTSFTLMMKKYTNFDTKRNSDAVYWMDLCLDRPDKDAMVSDVRGLSEGVGHATFTEESSSSEGGIVMSQMQEPVDPLDLLPNPVFTQATQINLREQPKDFKDWLMPCAN